MGITVGIDFGTTNSVTCVKKINVSTIHNAEGEQLTPSCVTTIPHPGGSSYELVVGRPARDLLKQYPEQTITSVKRLMGRDFDDPEVQNMINKRHVSYQIINEPSEPGSIKIPLGGKMQAPEMVSSLILRKLIEDAQRELMGKIEQAVVTVPAYFSDRQKFAVRAACDYAGIKLLRLLPEPTAAALSFGLGELAKDECQTIMIFDLGGGTFDISILSFAGGSFMEITKGGDMWLGGDNIDQLLIEYVFSQVQQSANCKPVTELVAQLSAADKARFLVELKEKAEAAKIELSSKDSANIEMFGLLKDEHNNLIDIDITITRSEFDRLLTPLVQRVVTVTRKILHEIRFEPELIDTVLLVGGSSLVPAIQDAIKNLFGKHKVNVHPRPMVAVAEGAAHMAAKMVNQENSQDESFAMMHSTAHDYYLQLADGKRHLLVARNTPLPFVVEDKLSFAHAKQYLARLRVFNDVDGLLETVGELWFHKEDTESDSSKPTQLVLRFSVDEDNIITMKAWSLQKEHVSVEAQIARGGLAAKLYNDLEHALSYVISNCDSNSIERSALCLSRKVVTTILATSDPITGETQIDLKQKAERQVETLKGLQQKELAPLGEHKFALLVRQQAADILSEDKKLRLENIINELEQALDHFDDIAKLEELHNQLQNFYEDLPIAADLAEAEDAALAVEKNYPSEAKQIRKQAKQVVALYMQKSDFLEDARMLLDDLINSFSWNYAGSGRFDRDVCL